MISTRVGYTGGTSPDPTYHRMGDHTESLQIDFDPSILPLSKLAEIFWENVAPGPSWSRQYMRAFFVASEEQRRVAEEARQAVGKRRKGLDAPLIPATRFYPAEDYHQKYYLRGRADVMAELSSVFAEPRRLLESTAAARLNGWAGGHCDVRDLRARGDELSLPGATLERVLRALG